METLAKYDPLREYLRGHSANEVALSFEQIGNIIKDKLPASAHRHRAWWSNHGGSHVNAIAWLEAGWKVENVSLSAKRVVFARSGRPSTAVLGERVRRKQRGINRARHIGYWDSAGLMVPSIEDLTLAHNVFLKEEPRNLFYVVARELVELRLQGKTRIKLAEALAVLLQTWNRMYYSRKRPFDEEHFQEIEVLLQEHRELLLALRERSISSLRKQDREVVIPLFEAFEAVLRRVGAAKALHLLAPDFFPIWDNTIANAYGLSLAAGARNGECYWTFMQKTKFQYEQVSHLLPGGTNVLKRLDEYNYCKYTKQWV